MPPAARFTLIRAALCVLLLPSACSFAPASRSAGEPSGGQLITAEMIADASLTTGWDVLRRYADHLSLDEHPERGPTRATRRGRESILLREEPLLVVDGARMTDFRSLAAMPAREISSMRILTGMQASTHFGMRAASGAIVIRTARR